MKFILSIVLLLTIACSKKEEKKDIDLNTLTETTVLTDSLGSGETVKSGDQIRIHFRVTMLKPQKRVGQNTYAKGRPALITLGARHIPPFFEEQLIGMNIGGKKSVFIPGDSLKRQPPIQLDMSVLELVEPIKMWDLGEFSYKSTKSGLKYYIIEEGHGENLKAGDNVSIHYSGFLKDGQKKFDSSVEKGRPLNVTIAKTPLIKGWTEGLQLLKRGSKVRLEIPSDLGYGDRGSLPIIPPKATLIFDMTVLDK